MYALTQVWSLILLASIVHGQTQTTHIPATITSQPTDFLTLANKEASINGLRIVPLETQGFVVEYGNSITSPQNTQLQIPCKAVCNPESIEYSWYKWKPSTKMWDLLTNTELFKWADVVNGDPTNAGMLTIKPYDKVANAGAYVCRAKCLKSVAVSKVLNLTAANFPNEGIPPSVTQRTVPAGTYTKLDVSVPTTVPAANASWTRTTSKHVPSGSGNEIPPDRTQMDEKGTLHIGYLDNSLLQVMGTTGTSNFNFFHFKYMSLRYIITDLAVYQLAVSGNVSSTVSCNLQYQTPSLSLVHGQSSRIACVYSGSPSIRVSYFKHDASSKPKQLTTQIVPLGDAEQIFFKTGLYGNTYVIGSARTTDAGTYTCSATFTTNDQKVCEGVTVPINVTVDLEPTFVSEPSSVTYVVEGQSITLQWLVKGRPKPTIKVGLDSVLSLPSVPKNYHGSEQISTIDHMDGMPVYSRSFTLFDARKLNDSHSVQVYATNEYHMAISSVALVVISPITFAVKMADQMVSEANSKATFVCTAYADDALWLTVSWTRLFDGVTYPVEDTGVGGQYSIVTNDASAPSGLQALSQMLTVDTSFRGNMNYSLGEYSCNVSNTVTWSVTTASLSLLVHVDEPLFDIWVIGLWFVPLAVVFAFIGAMIAVCRGCRQQRVVASNS